MCGTIPSAHWPWRSDRTSVTSLRVDAGEAERDERRVPVPLERIEPLGGLDELSLVVLVEDGQRLRGKRHLATTCVVRTYRCASSGSATWRRRGGRLRTSASKSSTTRSPISWRPPRRGRPGAARAQRRAHLDRMIRIERLGGEHVDRGAEATGEHELGQRAEVDDMGSAHEHEHGVRGQELEALTPRVGPCSRSWVRRGRRSRARSREVDRVHRLDPLLSEVDLREPRVTRRRGSRTARGALRRLPMFPTPTSPTRLLWRRNAEIIGELSQRLARPHHPISPDDVAACGEGQSERHLSHGSGKGGADETPGSRARSTARSRARAASRPRP